MSSIGKERIRAHESALLKHAQERLAGIEGLKFIGTAR